MTALTLHAQPYSLNERGFYFKSFEEYEAKYAENVSKETGLPVEEYEIQLIDGYADDEFAFEAMKVNQCNIEEFFEAAERVSELVEDEKAAVKYLMQHLQKSFEEALEECEDISIYRGTLTEVGMELAEASSLLDGVPDEVSRYFNYESYARDIEFNGGLVEIEDDVYVMA
ncbi:antirestriction protein ArdA [Chromobacterium haemolyticum]|uniref:antirestriction protein ArdA n=1 Tax=Chromobacterium haemolyticum TaxID=394935 RepID=UPI0009D9FF12|nr:antirestriction protein ArdA [Chromobacterium haemolyticum]OQS44837.1 hypothetical protein B0T39_00900 [Chromobacterium haemolyticum]